MLKGKLLVGQSGGPTPVINASLAGVVQTARQHHEIESVYGMVHGIEGALNDNLIDLYMEDPETIEMLRRTPASALGSCRHKISEAEYERILQIFQAHDIRYFIYIGGNDSMDTCYHISQLAASTHYDMQVIGVPKTIDNDLAETDHTPGYGSAARFFALAARDTGLDLEAMSTFDDVTILEAMGRNAGWLTAASALGKKHEDEAPHLIYVPERVFDEERFLEEVAGVHARLGRVFAVVCEGIKDSDGNFVGAHHMSGGVDAFGHALPTLSAGVASYLSDLVRERLKVQSRFLRPVLIGRAMSACISETDRLEAYQVGAAAVDYLASGESGWMVTIRRVTDKPYRSEIGAVALQRVANAEKLMPPEFLNPAGNMVTPAFYDYALPLIDGPLSPVARLGAYKVPQK
jgi:6-phosphofructokinase 1